MHVSPLIKIKIKFRTPAIKSIYKDKENFKKTIITIAISPILGPASARAHPTNEKKSRISVDIMRQSL